MRVLPGPTKSNHFLAWSHDNRWLVAGGSGDGVMVWDVNSGETGQRILMRAHGGRLIQFCPRTGRLFVAFQANGFWHWNPETGEEVQSHGNFNGYARVLSFAISPIRNLAAFQVHQFVRGRQRREISCCEITAEGRLNLLWSQPDSLWHSAQSFVFRGQTNELFLVGQDQRNMPQIRWINAETGAIIGELEVPNPTDPIRHWALSPQGDRVAWITDRAIYVHTLDNSSVLELPNPSWLLRRGLGWSPDGRILSYASGTVVNLLDANTLTELRSLDWGIGKPRAVAFAPDGLRCAVSGDSGRGWVTVFDLDIE